MDFSINSAVFRLPLKCQIPERNYWKGGQIYFGSLCQRFLGHGETEHHGRWVYRSKAAHLQATRKQEPRSTAGNKIHFSKAHISGPLLPTRTQQCHQTINYQWINPSTNPEALSSNHFLQGHQWAKKGQCKIGCGISQLNYNTQHLFILIFHKKKKLCIASPAPMIPCILSAPSCLFYRVILI